jgi:hypothetical protein
MSSFLSKEIPRMVKAIAKPRSRKPTSPATQAHMLSATHHSRSLELQPAHLRHLLRVAVAFV